MATLEAEKEYARVVESDLPLRQLKPFFSDWESVLEHHGDEMALKYSVHVNDPVCQGCGHGKATERRRFFWQASYDTRETMMTSIRHSALALIFGRLSLRHSYKTLRFPTVHCLCQQCLRGNWFKVTAGQLVGKVGGGLFWLSILGLVLFVCTEGYYITSHARLHDHLAALGCTAASAALMGVALWAMQVRRKWGIPVALRKIAKSPFQLETVQKV